MKKTMRGAIAEYPGTYLHNDFDKNTPYSYANDGRVFSNQVQCEFRKCLFAMIF